LGLLGHNPAPNGAPRRPAPDVYATDVVLEGTRGARFTLHLGGEHAPVALPLPGLYNVYNALAAAALASALGATFADVVDGLQATRAAFGRAETVSVGGRELSILLVKNPAGANEVLRTLAHDEGRHDVLAVLNDNTADGRDISWVWDADFEVIAERVRRVTCSGTRAAELALRLKYAGVPVERLRVVAPLEPALDAALGDGEGRLVALPTYTAMLALRELLVARGAAEGSFVR
jgi:UDP-N-acetylmuramyl tripeptide synthase